MVFSRYERQELTTGQPGREFIRNPSEQPTDRELKSRINAVIEQTLGAADAKSIKVGVDKGVVTLKGKIANADSEGKLEHQIQTVPGVTRVDNRLTKDQ